MTAENVADLEVIAVDSRSTDERLEVAGIVAAWGRLEVHPDGFRAEYARPRALLVFDVDRRSRYRELVREAADAYGVEVLELRVPEDLPGYCERNAPGLDLGLIEELVGGPTEPDAAWLGAGTPLGGGRGWSDRLLDGLRAIGFVVAAGIGVLVSAAFCLGLAAVVIGTLLSAVGLIDDGRGRAFSERERRLEVVDEGLVRLEGGRLYVAVVRNRNQRRAALSVHPTARFLDRDGRRIGGTDPAPRVDNAPNLLPGQTGVVIDHIDGARFVDGRVERIRTELAARGFPRAPPRQPVRVTHAELDTRRCVVLADVIIARPMRRVDVALVGWSEREALAGADTGSAGPLPKGRSRQVVYRMPRRGCRAGLELEAYPNLSRGQVAARSSEH